MKVLVTGGAGYIGSVLVKGLLEDGHTVKCLDRFFFGKEPLVDVLDHPNLELIRDDVRWFDPNILKGVETVMDLAALSNDPSGDLDPAKTYDINYLGRIRVARLSKEYGVKRYILASSCSVYGFQDETLDEESPVKPLTTYAKANRKAEQDVLPLADSNFTATALRFATVYGYSGRMRFDLAVNGMVLSLFKNPKLSVMRDGKQWRPFIHINDVVRAYKSVIIQNPSLVNGQIFNVGSDEQNYQILPLAELVGHSLGIPYEIDWYGSTDSRSYKVSFKKFKQACGFAPQYTPADGAREIFEALQSGKLTDSIKTRTVEWYRYLLNCHSLISETSLRNTIL